jgi:hypothetical protein
MRLLDLPSRVITVDAARLARFQAASPFASEPFVGVRAPKIGCTLSHLALWKEVAEGPHACIVVFEDDARLARRLDATDDAALRRFLRREVPVMLLGYHPNVRCSTHVEDGLLEGHFLDSHAYVLTRTGAARLLRGYGAALAATRAWLVPLGAVDTIFLVEKVCALTRMAFVQADTGRYEGISLWPQQIRLPQRLYTVFARAANTAVLTLPLSMALIALVALVALALVTLVVPVTLVLRLLMMMMMMMMMMLMTTAASLDSQGSDGQIGLALSHAVAPHG